MAARSIAAIHTAARRYCIDQLAHWRRLCDESRARRGEAAANAEDDYRTLPRYNAIDAILYAIEHWWPEEAATLDEARARLIADGRTAQSRFTLILHHERAANAIREERERFERFVRAWSEADGREVEPLPFQRVLAAAEVDALREWFRRRWGTWYAGVPERDDVPELTLHVVVWRELPLLEVVRTLLAGRGVRRLFQLRESVDSLEIELGDTDFQFGGDESYWFIRDGDWMLYESHEDSITLGGSWLVEAARAALPAIDELVYRGWGRPPSLRGGRAPTG